VDLKAASADIKQQALDLGFFACGIAEASFLQNHEPRLSKWLNDGAMAKWLTWAIISTKGLILQSWLKAHVQ
jgi:epoxyqueuosine reductase QueG